MKRVRIHCVVEDSTDQSQISHEIRWPVLSCVPLPAVWPFQSGEIFDHNKNPPSLSLLLIFTSARSIRYFIKNFTEDINQLAALKRQNKIQLQFAFVGLETYQAALENLQACGGSSGIEGFPPECFVIPSLPRGLRTALSKVITNGDQNSPNYHIGIVTSQDGKTSQTLREFIAETPEILELAKNISVVQIYCLENQDKLVPRAVTKIASNFLANKNSKYRQTFDEIEFLCKSGRVVLETVRLLTQLCQVSDATLLPSQFFFVPWEISATQQILELGLGNRMRQL